jgi:hypothetical protein
MHMPGMSDFQSLIAWTTKPGVVDEAQPVAGAQLRWVEPWSVWMGELHHSLAGDPLHDRFSGTLITTGVGNPVHPIVAVQFSIGIGTDRAAASIVGAGIEPVLSEAVPVTQVLALDGGVLVARMALEPTPAAIFDLWLWPTFHLPPRP